jgi:hypothetical protein
MERELTKSRQEWVCSHRLVKPVLETFSFFDYPSLYNDTRG